MPGATGTSSDHESIIKHEFYQECIIFGWKDGECPHKGPLLPPICVLVALTVCMHHSGVPCNTGVSLSILPSPHVDYLFLM